MPARADDIIAFDGWLSHALESGAVAVVSHRNGDMDTIGSACALASLIGGRARACGLHLSTIARSVVESTGADFLKIDAQRPVWPRELGGVIIVDAADIGQTGVDLPDVPLCIIDHHDAGEDNKLGEGDLLLRWQTCSTTEIIHAWAEHSCPERLDETTCRLLLAGIITDTGRFRHANSDALGAASALAKIGGIDYASFIEEMESVELNHSQKVSIAKALSRVQTIEAGKWFLMYTRAGTNEGIVARSLISAGADVALVHRNIEGECRMTARASRKATQANLHLGEMMQDMVSRSGGEGGGHAGAAGWTGAIDAVDATSGFIALLSALTRDD
jgi:nanoRNase/pAp phosphatase (c-di-AMP/oligoRNAs hydrolase)